MKGEKKPEKAKKKKAKKKATKGVVKDKKEPASQPEPEIPALARAGDLVEMLLLDPTDDYLVEQYVSESRALEGGPAGALGAIAEACPDLASHPNWAVVKARVLIESGDPDAALAILETSHASDPVNPSAAYFLALALQKAGKTDQARQLLGESLGLASGGKTEVLRAKILASLVGADVAAGDAAAASAHFADLCAETGELAESFEEILSLHAVAGDQAGAIAFVDAVMQAHLWAGFEKYYLFFEKAVLLEGADRDADALAEAKKAVKAHPAGSAGCVDLVDLVFDLAGEEEAPGILLKASKDPCFYVNAALNLEQAGRLEQALAVLAKGQARFPGDVDLFLGRVDMMIRAGDVAQAVELLREGAKKEDVDPLVVVKLAEVLLDTGDRTEALDILSKLGAKSKNPAVHEVLEQFYDSVGEPALAKKENEILVKIAPGDPEPLVRLGERLYSEGKIEEAFALWQKIPDLYTNQAEGLLRLADVLLDHGSYTKAEDAYKKASDNGGAGTEAMRKIALYYDLVGNATEAEKWWRMLLDAPDASFGMKREAGVRLIHLWQRTFKLAQQLPLVVKMHETEPDRMEVSLLLATVYLELGRDEECRQVLEQLLVQIGNAAASAPQSQRDELLEAADHVLTTLDRINRLAKLWSEAMGAFEEAAVIFPDKAAELKLKVAEYAVLAGQHERAREAIDAALSASPGDPDVNGKAADLLFQIGDMEKAASCLALIVAKDPGLYEERLRLARALVHLERWDEAADELADLVEECPYDYVGSEALSLLSTVVGSGHGSMDLEAWLYKLFIAGKGHDFAGRKLADMYLDRLGGGPSEEMLIGGTSGGVPGDPPPEWLVRAGKVAAKIIVDGPSDARYEALSVLSYVHDPEVSGSLLKRAKYLKNPVHQVMAIVGASGGVLPEHAAYLEDLAGSASPDVRAASVLCLAFTGDQSVLSAIENQYFSAAPEVRAAAVLATGLLMARTHVGVDQGTTEAIVTLLRTRQWRVTYQAAILTLGVMGGEDASSQIMNFIASKGRTEPDGEGQTKVTAGDQGSLTMRLALLALAAGSFEGPDVLDALVDGCWSGDEKVREMAGWALLLETREPGVVIRPLPTHIPLDPGMQFGRLSVGSVLEKFASAPGYGFDSGTVEKLRPILEEALDGRLADHAMVPIMDNERLVPLLDTIEVLDAAQGGPSWLPFTDHLIDDGGSGRGTLESVVGSRAGMIGDILGVVLDGTAAGVDPAIVGLISILGKIGGTVPPQPLVKIASGSGSAALRTEAIGALASFDSGETVDVFRSMLGEASWSLRLEMVQALARMQDPAAASLLLAISEKDSSAAVREAALGCKLDV